MTPTANLRHCSFNKETGTLTIASEFFGGSFPEEVAIESDHTGNVVRFKADHVAAERAEWWDGEMFEYTPIDPTNNCTRLVVIHEF